MYMPALELAENEAKLVLRPEMNRKWASISQNPVQHPRRVQLVVANVETQHICPFLSVSCVFFRFPSLWWSSLKFSKLAMD